jgi:hypothetical protein
MRKDRCSAIYGTEDNAGQMQQIAYGEKGFMDWQLKLHWRGISDFLKSFSHHPKIICSYVFRSSAKRTKKILEKWKDETKESKAFVKKEPKN